MIKSILLIKKLELTGCKIEMPKSQSAKKALRQTRKKTIANKIAKEKAKNAIKAFKKHPQKEELKKVYSLLDKLAKKNIFHKNKSNRLKSKLAALISSKKTEKPSKKSQKTTKKGATKKTSRAKKMAKR